MPYIKDFHRMKYDIALNAMPLIDSKGELEYCIFKLMRIYMFDKVHSYTHLHDCVYAVQHCADEFKRRFLDKRENDAREANGDIDALWHTGDSAE